jgi:hypothetical protein
LPIFTLFFWTTCLCISVIGTLGLLGDYPVIAWIFSLFAHFLAIYYVRNFAPLVILLLFNLLFVIYAIPHIFFGVNIVSMEIEKGLPFLTQVLWQISLFISVFCFVLKLGGGLNATGGASYVQVLNRINMPFSSVLFYVIGFFILIAIIFLIRGDVIYAHESTYQAYYNNLRKISGLPEYLLILFFLSACLARGRFKRGVWYVIWAVYSIKMTLLGLRVPVLMSSILAFWFLGVRISIGKTVGLFIAGFIIFSVLGLIKETQSSEYIMESLLFETHDGNLVTHHGNVLWASTVMLDLLDSGEIDLNRRASLLGYQLMSSIVPSKIVDALLEMTPLSVWLQSEGYSSGGGHFTTLIYISSGTLGIVLMAILFAKAGLIALSPSKGMAESVIRSWFLMTLITFPRWISYDFSNFFFRLPIYVAIGFLLIKLVEFSLQHNWNNHA